jgi:S1-C subfamily serine protease
VAQIALGLGLEAARKPILAYIWYRIAARTTSDPTLRDRAIQGQNRPLPGEAANSSVSPKPVSSGSGFFVSHDGDLITANHVVDGCRELRVVCDDKSNVARVIGTDAGGDLAILRVPDVAGDIASFPAAGLEKPGEPVIVAGYPLQGLLTSKASVTTGIISALAGPNEDKKLIQITAPVQPGNSGGPLVDTHGTVIGVVVSKLNGLRVARATGSIPENINFAVTSGPCAGTAR